MSEQNNTQADKAPKAPKNSAPTAPQVSVKGNIQTTKMLNGTVIVNALAREAE